MSIRREKRKKQSKLQRKISNITRSSKIKTQGDPQAEALAKAAETPAA